jgi:DNA-binding NarL/FixJ family response regulator
MRPATVLLVDDHPVVRAGVRSLLDGESDLRVVAEASDGLDAVRLAQELRPDLAILDVTMPGLTGLQAARQISQRCPHTRVLILSMHAGGGYRAEAARVGAAGYVVKSAVDRELVGACRAALAGEPMDAAPREARAGRGELTAREGEVAKLVAEGHSTREIATALVISEKTVERHKGSVLGKLGLRDRVDVARWAIRTGLVEQ